MRRRNAYCSFCRKSYTDVGPLVEGPGDVYICGGCVELCQSIIEQEIRRRKPPRKPASAAFLRENLDQFVSGQDEAKQALLFAAGCRSEGRGRVLLTGASRSTKVLLARALAYALEAPFAVGDANDLVGSRHDSPLPLLFNLLQASDFDAEAAQRGVVFVDGAERQETQAALLRLWNENLTHPFEGIQLVARGILFVCGGAFARGSVIGHSEQPATVEGLCAFGVQSDWARCLAAIAPVPPLDEESLVRIAQCVDFGRIDADRVEPG